MSYHDFDEDSQEEDGVKRGLLIFVIAILLAVALFLSSCTYADVNRVVFVGGKGAYKSKAFALTTDNEKSLSDIALLAAIAIPAAQAVALGKSADKLSAVQSTNATNQAINATNAAAATEQFGIEAASEVPKFIPK